jgi:hypothetical protein
VCNFTAEIDDLEFMHTKELAIQLILACYTSLHSIQRMYGLDVIDICMLHFYNPSYT